MTALCIPWNDTRFLPMLAWQAMAELAYQSDHSADPVRRDDVRKRAIGLAHSLLDNRNGGLVPLAISAGAEHLLGYLLSRQGLHADAQQAFDHAALLWQRNGSVPQALAAQFNIAQELLALGKPRDAMARLGTLLHEPSLDRRSGIRSWAENDYCLSLRALDRSSEAIDCFRRLAPRLLAAGELKEGTNALCNWGASLGTVRRWHEAAIVLGRCATFRHQLGLPLGLAHVELLLGWVALEQGQLIEATGHFEASLTYADQSGDQSRVWEAQRWLAQAWIESDALAKAREALLAHKPDAVQEPARHALWHVALGEVAIADEDSIGAERDLRQAISELETLGLETAVADARCRLALLNTSIGVERRCGALALGETVLARGRAEESRRYLKTKAEGEEDFVLHRLVALTLADDVSSVRMARAILTDLLALSTEDPSTSQIRSRLLSLAAFEFARLAHSGGTPQLARAAMDALLAVRGAKSPLSVDLLDRKERSVRLAHRPPLGTLELEDGDLAVASVGRLGTTYVLTGMQTGVVLVNELRTERLRKAVSQWRYAVATDQDVVRISSRLATELALPQWWRPEARRLVVAVHGALADVAWAALPVNGDAVPGIGFRPLVTDASVVGLAYPASASRSAVFPREVRILLVGESGLPGAQQEAENIESLARAANWRVASVTPATDPRQSIGILHIAGHAKASMIDGSASTLLNGGSDEAAFAWPRTWIARSNLVTLAGCETAAGPLSRWQAPDSLATRAIRDGAQTVLAHLWPIADLPAAHLHEQFYRQLFAGERVDVALAEAQRALIASGRDRALVDWASGIVLTPDLSLLHR